jgi:hypothetical protein
MKSLFDKIKKEEKEPDLSENREKFIGKIRSRNLITDIMSMGFPGIIVLCFLLTLLTYALFKFLGG